MRKLATLSLIGLSLAAFLLADASPIVLAASPTPGTGQALEIAPPLLNLKTDPGKTIHAQLKLRDVSKTDLIVTNQVNDFVAAGESGTPKILTNNDSLSPFSMKDWVEPISQLTLKPQQIKNIPVTIDVPKTASPGGHYAVIRFTGRPPSLKGQGVSLSASLGALVLLTVNGKISHHLSIAQFITTHIPPKPDPSNPKPVSQDLKPVSLFESAPLNFVIKLKNTGNIQEQPVGHIVISNMFGKPTAGINVNLARRNVLPASTRKFEVPLNKDILGNKWLFGPYHAVMTVKYGANGDQTTTASLTFWVIPWKLIVGIIVALIVAFFVLRYLLRRYNQRIISKAGGQPTPKTQKPTRAKKPRSRKRSK